MASTEHHGRGSDDQPSSDDILEDEERRFRSNPYIDDLAAVQAGGSTDGGSSNDGGGSIDGGDGDESLLGSVGGHGLLVRGNGYASDTDSFDFNINRFQEWEQDIFPNNYERLSNPHVDDVAAVDGGSTDGGNSNDGGGIAEGSDSGDGLHGYVSEDICVYGKYAGWGREIFGSYVTPGLTN